MSIEYLSLTTTPIFLFNNNVEVSQGTGFYMAHEYESKLVLFLVTNYHVLTGNAPKDKKKSIGNKIQFYIHKNDTNSNDIKKACLPLFNKDGKPIWLVNEKQTDADLAIIPIPEVLYKDCKKIKCISEEWAGANMKVRPATNISLIGYPYGYYDQTNSLPVWKTGSIASEPSVDFEGNPYFLVDVSAFPGMSGAPVFSIAYGIYEVEDGATVAGNMRKFLGIYASMQMLNKEMYLEQFSNNTRYGIRDSVSLELGHVWKADLIIDTLQKFDIEKYNVEILKL